MRYLVFNLLFIISSSISIPAQIIEMNLKAVATNKIIAFLTETNTIPISEGDSIHIKGFMEYNSQKVMLVKIKNITYFSNLTNLNRIEFVWTNKEEFWMAKFVESSIKNWLKKGWQFDLRSDQKESSLTYLNRIRSINGFIEDYYLENYLYSLIRKIYPSTLYTSKIGNINVWILDHPDPNAYAFSSGTIVIHSGLITLLESEEELMAVLAHEIAHIALDHSINNIIDEIKRHNRAAFWSVFATLTAAATEVYLTSKGYEAGGIVTLSTAIISQAFSAAILEELGVKYSLNQENSADNTANQFMTKFNENPIALASALTKIRDYYLNMGDLASVYSENGSHPLINQRINDLGSGTIDRNESYLKTISRLTTRNAYLEKYSNNFENCLSLVRRNIELAVGVEDDYILQAEMLSNLFSERETDFEALESVKTAIGLGVNPNIRAFKVKGVLELRLGMNDEAEKSFQLYADKLKSNFDVKVIRTELSWANEMAFKAKKLY